jgi:hypothetical protein
MFVSLKRLVEEGIPSVIREHAWLYLSGALNLMRTRRPEYKALFPKAFESPHLELIDLDISRTFADDPNWRNRGYDTVTRRVLAGYSIRNKTVGYCQGLSYLVGTLVTVVNEESAFLILSAIIEDGLLPSDYYTSLKGALVDRQVLDLLVERFIPGLAEAFSLIEDAGNVADFTFMSIPWHMCLFSANLSHNKAIRVWDFLLSLGPCVLFRVSLGILNELADQLRIRLRAAGAISSQKAVFLDVRNILRQIEQRTTIDDLAIYCFHQFGECTNALIDQYRDSVRRQEIPMAGGAPALAVTIEESPCRRVSDEKYFGDPRISTTARDERREIIKRTIDGLGDFMGQPRYRRSANTTHHTR